MSSLVNKVKEAVRGDKTSQPEGTHGPHNSRVANAADPRIDSDHDHRAAHDLKGTGETYSGTGQYTTGGGAYTAGSRPIGTDGPATKTDGPHKSNIMNKADPRVDSDRDHSRNMGMNPEGTSGTGAYNVNETTRTGGLGGNNFGTHENIGTSNFGARENIGTTHGSSVPEGTFGPHGSRVANAADPRIDSDLDGSRNMGARSGAGAGGLGNTTTTHGTAAHGSHSTTTHGLGGHSGTTHGTATHGSHGLGGHSGTTHTGQGYASGPAPNTAGPHKSDMMNKIDPRVDSDLDGSKTMGGDKTFSRSNQNTFATHKDPTDAAQVPPSVLQKHIGAPVIEHDGHAHDRTRRHSVSHQEQHRGL